MFGENNMTSVLFSLPLKNENHVNQITLNALLITKLVLDNSNLSVEI